MASKVLLTAAGLDTFKDKSIKDICPCGYNQTHTHVRPAHGHHGHHDHHSHVGHDQKINHCAHFVSHVLKLNDALHIGVTCAQMTSKGKTLKSPGAGACLRVNEVFNFC